jgi:hypothetical protein
MIFKIWMKEWLVLRKVEYRIYNGEGYPRVLLVVTGDVLGET